MKALIGAFNQEKALVGAFSVNVQLHRLIVLLHLNLGLLLRCWQLGQSRSDPLVDQFEHAKIGLMYVVNVAKYVSNPRFKQDLIEKTGEWPLVGGRSTADWEKWNGLIHSLIREKIKNDADLHIDLARDVSNLVEMKKLQVEMLALWKEPEAESESDSDAIYHQVNLS